jgi:hypothetical protein
MAFKFFLATFLATVVIRATNCFAWAAGPDEPTRSSLLKSWFKLAPAWIAIDDLLGMSIVLLGPKTDSHRAVISITPAPTAPTSVFNSRELEVFQDSYRFGREDWLRKVGGSSVRYLPFRDEIYKNIKMHRIGYRYRLHGEEFIEHSVFAECPGQILHIKALLPAERQAADEADFEQMLRSLNCEVSAV